MGNKICQAFGYLMVMTLLLAAGCGKKEGAETTGDESAAAAPAPDTAFVVVDSSVPQTMTITVDGKETGTVAPFHCLRLTVPVGEATIVAKADGKAIDEIKATLEKDKEYLYNPTGTQTYITTTYYYQVVNIYSPTSTTPVSGVNWDTETYNYLLDETVPLKARAGTRVTFRCRELNAEPTAAEAAAAIDGSLRRYYGDDVPEKAVPVLAKLPPPEVGPALLRAYSSPMEDSLSEKVTAAFLPIITAEQAKVLMGYLEIETADSTSIMRQVVGSGYNPYIRDLTRLVAVHYDTATLAALFAKLIPNAQRAMLTGMSMLSADKRRSLLGPVIDVPGLLENKAALVKDGIPLDAAQMKDLVDHLSGHDTTEMASWIKPVTSRIPDDMAVEDLRHLAGWSYTVNSAQLAAWDITKRLVDRGDSAWVQSQFDTMTPNARNVLIGYANTNHKGAASVEMGEMLAPLCLAALPDASNLCHGPSEDFLRIWDKTLKLVERPEWVAAINQTILGRGFKDVRFKPWWIKQRLPMLQDPVAQLDEIITLIIIGDMIVLDKAKILIKNAKDPQPIWEALQPVLTRIIDINVRLDLYKNAPELFKLNQEQLLTLWETQLKEHQLVHQKPAAIELAKFGSDPTYTERAYKALQERFAAARGTDEINFYSEQRAAVVTARMNAIADPATEVDAIFEIMPLGGTASMLAGTKILAKVDAQRREAGEPGIWPRYLKLYNPNGTPQEKIDHVTASVNFDVNMKNYLAYLEGPLKDRRDARIMMAAQKAIGVHYDVYPSMEALDMAHRHSMKTASAGNDSGKEARVGAQTVWYLERYLHYVADDDEAGLKTVNSLLRDLSKPRKAAGFMDGLKVVLNTKREALIAAVVAKSDEWGEAGQQVACREFTPDLKKLDPLAIALFTDMLETTNKYPLYDIVRALCAVLIEKGDTALPGMREKLIALQAANPDDHVLKTEINKLPPAE